MVKRACIACCCKCIFNLANLLNCFQDANITLIKFLGWMRDEGKKRPAEKMDLQPTTEKKLEIIMTHDNENVNHNDQEELHLPMYCILKAEIRENKNIPDGAKIYFGELCVLANKFGYCYATDEQLAKMKDVPIKTIERWNLQLEKSGFIKRDTENKPSKNTQGKWSWKKTRKIYVFEEPSKSKSNDQKEGGYEQKQNKDHETPKNEGSIEVPKNEGSNASPENEGYNNKTSNGEQINNNPGSPSAPVVVVSSPLDELEISQDLRNKILKDHPDKDMSVLVKRTLAWKSRPSDAVGALTALKNWETWSDPQTPEERAESNLKLLESLRKYEHGGSSVKADQAIVVVYSKSIAIGYPSKMHEVSIEEKDFKQRVKELIEKYNIQKK